MIPRELEIKARQLVLDAISQGGEMWAYVTPPTIELLVEAIALDLLEHEERLSPEPPDLGPRPRPPA